MSPTVLSLAPAFDLAAHLWIEHEAMSNPPDVEGDHLLSYATELQLAAANMAAHLPARSMAELEVKVRMAATLSAAGFWNGGTPLHRSIEADLSYLSAC